MYETNFTKFKLVFLGDQSVGKTSIVTRFMYNSFSENYQATIGIDFLSQTITLDGRTIRLQIWDTAGQERFKSLTPAYIRDSSVAVIVYDISNLRSFNDVTEWVESVKAERGDDVMIVLVGNKTDLTAIRKISTASGEEKAKELNVMFFETSAKSDHNIKKLFNKISSNLLKKEPKDKPKPINIPLPPPEDSQTPQTWTCCNT